MSNDLLNEEIIIRKAMATVEVCYHSMRAASEKMDDAPMSADTHLQEAMQACMALLRSWDKDLLAPGMYSKEAVKVRVAAQLEMGIWKGQSEK